MGHNGRDPPPPARAFQRRVQRPLLPTPALTTELRAIARGWGGQTLKLKPNQCPDHGMEETIRNTVDFKTSFHQRSSSDKWNKNDRQTQSFIIFLLVETPLLGNQAFSLRISGTLYGLFPPLNIIFNRYFITP